MLNIYKLLNKSFLIGMANMAFLLPVLVLMGCLFDSGVLLIEATIYLLTLVTFFMGVLSIVSSNQKFYRENLSWILFLPITRKKIYMAHIMYVLVQLIEVTFMVIASFFLSKMIQSIKYPKIIDLTREGEAESWWNFSFSNIMTFSVHDISYLLLGGLLLFGLLFLISDGTKIKDRVSFLNSINKDSLTIMGFLFFIAISFFSLNFSPPLIIIMTCLIVFIVWQLVMKHILTFHLKVSKWLMPRLYFPLSFFIMFLMMFSTSLIHVSSSTISKSMVDDYKFLGQLTSSLSEKKLFDAMNSKDLSTDLISELKGLYLKKNNKNSLNMEKFDYISLIISKSDPRKVASIVDFLNVKKLHRKEKERLIKHAKALKLLKINEDKQRACDDCYERVLRHLTAGKMAFSDIRYLLESAEIDLTAKRFVLEKTIFVKRPYEMLKTVLKNHYLLNSDPARSINILSLLKGKKIDIFNLHSRAEATREISSMREVKDCSDIDEKALGSISEKNIGGLVYCSNQKYIDQKDISQIGFNRYRAIRSWPEIPLSNHVKSILSYNLKLLK